jgi:hypothetical protein
MQPERAPRGSLLITGEDLPPGHSVRARCLVLELTPGEVSLEALSRMQREVERLSLALSAWVRWLAGRLEGVRKQVRLRTAELRPAYPAEHGRTTDAVARLHAVWEVVRAYWQEIGFIDEAQAVALEREIIGVLQAVAGMQAGYQQDADPTQRFIPLLLGLFSSRRAHLGNRMYAEEPPLDAERWGWLWQPTANVWAPQGPQVGWVDEQGIYLEPTTAYAALNRLATESGEPLPTPRTLWKRLGERGLIRSQERGGRVRYGVGVRIQGVTRDVLHIPGGILAKNPNSPNTANNNVPDEEKPVGKNQPVGSNFSPNSPSEEEGYEVQV